MTSNLLEETFYSRASRFLGIIVNCRLLVRTITDEVRIKQPEGYPDIGEWEYEYSYFDSGRDSVISIFYHADFPERCLGSCIPYLSVELDTKRYNERDEIINRHYYDETVSA